MRSILKKLDKRYGSSFNRVSGNLIELAKEGKFTHIGHGCNCFNTMGAGIALQIAKHFPAAVTVDQLTRKGDIKKLSNYTVAHQAMMDTTKSFNIVNFYTQFQPGKFFMPSALDLALYKFCYEEDTDENTHLGIPWIGCGIGGGNIKDVTKILKHYSESIKITVVDYLPIR